MKVNDLIRLKTHISELHGLAPTMRVLDFSSLGLVKVGWPNYRGEQFTTGTPLTHLQKNYISLGKEN
jgi:hypothetical protein